MRSTSSASRLGVATPVVETTTMLSMSSGLRLGLFQKPARHRLQQIHGVVDIKLGAVHPAVIAQIPFDRHAGITPRDAGILEHGNKPGDVAHLREQAAGILGGFALGDDIRRHGGFQGQKAGTHQSSFTQ